MGAFKSVSSSDSTQLLKLDERINDSYGVFFAP